MISPGQTPDFAFTIKALESGQTVERPFRDLITGPSIISVYMRNNTSACDKQIASLIAHTPEIEKSGWRILAVSRDTCASHAKYAAKTGAAFTLVSDPADLISSALDAIVEKSMYGKKYRGPARAAYLVDAAGKILAVIPKVDAPLHGQQVLDAIRAQK